jgi:hypothetical protein
MIVLARLRHDRIDAPMLIDGAIAGASFRACLGRVLAPTLRPGDIVVLDSLGIPSDRPSEPPSGRPARTSSSSPATAPT